jgi:hypothetical protein
MGTRGREIVGMDVNELLRLLNQAYAIECLPVINTGSVPK